MSAGVFAHWPNRITALRFVGAVALFVGLALVGDADPLRAEAARVPYLWLFWLFIAVALSDILDGYLARRYGWVSAFGRIADPFVDKVLVLGSMVFLATLSWSMRWFPAWLVVVVMSREFLITGIRGYAETRGVHFPADWFGKVKMAVQCWGIGIVLGLAAFEFPLAAREFLEHAAWFCMLATLVTTLGSGLSYLIKLRKLLGSAAPDA